VLVSVCGVVALIALVLLVRASGPTQTARCGADAAFCGDCRSFDTSLFSVTVGMTERSVDALGGVVWAAGGRCTLYRGSRTGANIDGLRFCFAHGRVSGVQTALHG
jgi:hypothetical protein